jgi:thioredoxin-related protein
MSKIPQALAAAVITVFIGLILAPPPLRPAVCKSNEKIAWLDYNQALIQARRENKPIVVYFYKPHCRVCDMLKQNGFEQPDLACYVNQNLIAAAVNGDTEAELRDEYNITAAPTVWLLTPKADGIDYFIGYIGPEDLSSILHYIGDKAYETQSYERYLKEQKRKQRVPT